MLYSGKVGRVLTQALAVSLMVTLLLAVACGAAAPATPAPAKAPQPAAAQPAAAVPTPAPAAKSAPAAPAATAINPGKLTWMIAGWGNERFDYTFSVGGGNNYARIMAGFLIATNEKAELIPGIATDWRVSDDGRTWTVTVRKGAKFHNGAEITAEDVLWTWQHQWNPEAIGWATQSGAQGVARTVEKIEQPGPDKVSITTKIVDASLLLNFSEASAGWWAILPKREKLHDEALEAAYDKNPIGAGPMKLVKRVPAELMVFERFADYYYQPKNGLPEDRRVKFTSLDLRLVPEEATRVAAIRAGEADTAPVSLATRKQVEAGGGRVVFGPEGVYMFTRLLGCWKLEFPCGKKEVRQALAYALDLNVFRDKLYGAEVFVPKGWAGITPNTTGYSPEIDPVYDPQKARQLLAQAGYPGGKGFPTLLVHTWVSTAVPFLPESAQLAADMWRKELGIPVEVKVGDETALKKASLTEELHGQMLFRDNEVVKDPGGRVRNWWGVSDHKDRQHNDPALFKLAQETLAVFDPEKREQAFIKLFRVLRDEQYQMGVGYLNLPWAVGPRVLDWKPWPMAFYPSNLHGIVLK